MSFFFYFFIFDCSIYFFFFFFSSRRRHTRYIGDWSSDVCSSDLSLTNLIAHFFPTSFTKTLRPGSKRRNRRAISICTAPNQNERNEKSLESRELMDDQAPC